MAIDMTDPNAVRKFLESKNAVAYGGVPAPQAPSAPSAPVPAFNPSFGVPQSNPVPAPSFGAPSAPKDMSGYKPQTPMFQPPNPVPAPASTPNATGGVSGTLTAEQMKFYNSLPPEARNGYLNGVGGSQGSAPGIPSSGYKPPGTGMYPSAPTVPAPQSNGYPVMTPDQIRAEVAAKIAAETAKRTTAANQAKTGLQTSYDRLRSTTNDTRTLENVQNARNLNPFSGRSDFAQGMIGRERAITDRQQSEDLATRLANIDVSLKDYQDATPEQQRAMENELTRQERSYALQVDQANYQKQRDATSDTRYANETSYNHGQDKITNDRNAANDALILRKQHIDEANYYSDKYGITVEPKDSFQEVINQVKGLPTVAQQSAAQKADDTRRSEAWKRVDQFGYVQSQADADLLGVSVGTQSQKAKEAAMDAAYKDRTANIAQKNADTAAKNADTAANKPVPAIKGATIESVSKYANGVARYQDGELLNPDQVEAAILSYDLPETELRKLYATYGLKWGG